MVILIAHLNNTAKTGRNDPVAVSKALNKVLTVDDADKLAQPTDNPTNTLKPLGDVTTATLLK